MKQHFRVPYPIMLCTYTNVAVDNLVEGFLENSPDSMSKHPPLKPLRIGSLGKVRPSLEPHTLEARMAAHPLAPQLEIVKGLLDGVVKRRKELGQTIKELRTKLGMAPVALKPDHNVHSRDQAVHGRARGLQGRLEAMEADALTLETRDMAYRRRLYAMRMEMITDVVKGSDVVSGFVLFVLSAALMTFSCQICTTCISSASSALSVVDFPVVFIDEASMSTEPASLIPLMKGVSEALSYFPPALPNVRLSLGTSPLLETISSCLR